MVAEGSVVFILEFPRSLGDDNDWPLPGQRFSHVHFRGNTVGLVLPLSMPGKKGAGATYSRYLDLVTKYLHATFLSRRERLIAVDSVDYLL